MRNAVSTEKAPRPIGPYSQAVIENGLVFVAGQGPGNPETGQLEMGDVRSQTRRVFSNMRAILEAAGSSMEKVVRCNVYLKDIGDFAAMNEIYATQFEAPYPARTTIQAGALPGGISVDPLDGTLWAGTGNAHVVVEGSLRADAALAERVLRLTPALRVRGSASQTFHAAENLGDQGFGSTPLLFRPTGCDPVAAANSKNGAMYVWRRAPWRPAPIFTARIGPTEPHDPFLSQPTWFPEARALVVGQGIVDRENGRVRGVVGFKVDARCRFRLDWVVNIGPGPTVQPLAAGSTAFVPAPQLGKLAAVDVARGRHVRLFDTGQVLASPISVGGTLFVASADGTVRAYR